MLFGAMRSILLLEPSITDIVGDRIFPGGLPQDAATPAVDMRVVGRGVTQALQGGVILYIQEVIFDCYADDSPEVADAVAYGILASQLVGYQGTIEGTHIRGVVAVEAPNTQTESVDPGSDRLRFVTSVSVEVAWFPAT